MQEFVNQGNTDDPYPVESIDGLHSCHEFITMVRNDSKLTFKPDWKPQQIHRRLTYKRDHHWYYRVKETISTTDFLTYPVFIQSLINGHSFLACIRTENIECAPSDEKTLRIVFETVFFYKFDMNHII